MKVVTDLLSIDNVMEFDHGVTGALNTWERERGSRYDYYRKLDEMYSKGQAMDEEERRERKRRFAHDYYG